MGFVVSIKKAVADNVTIQMRPAENIDGWNLSFRAKAAPVNPDLKTATWLAEDVADDDDTILVNSTVGFPLEGPFKIRIDNEVLQVTDGVGYFRNAGLDLEWSVERGVWGTTAADHVARARVALFSTPQMLLDNGDHGGVTVEDADTGVIRLDFAASFTAERPVGTYFWNLMRTDSGYERIIAEGVLYLLPSATSAFDEPPLHNA
jgi:hypothetical protein